MEWICIVGSVGLYMILSAIYVWVGQMEKEFAEGGERDEG